VRLLDSGIIEIRLFKLRFCRTQRKEEETSGTSVKEVYTVFHKAGDNHHYSEIKESIS
jgi:hypothetical protein